MVLQNTTDTIIFLKISWKTTTTELGKCYFLQHFCEVSVDYAPNLFAKVGTDVVIFSIKITYL